MTSSILPPRRDFAPCSPITQASASTTLDLPDPLGPTMQVMPGSSWSVVADAKDLNPRRVRLCKYTWAPSPPARQRGSPYRPCAVIPGTPRRQKRAHHGPSGDDGGL